MAASTSNSETQNVSDKKQIKFDKEIFRDVDEFPVNFSGVPHIGQRILGYLDFEDFNSCRTVCKGQFNLLYGNRNSWIKLLEKEKVRKIKLSSEDLDSDVFSDSDDNFENDELWTIHLRQEHKNSGIFLGRRGRSDENLSDDEIDKMKGYVLFVKLYFMYNIVCMFNVYVYQHVIIVHK